MSVSTATANVRWFRDIRVDDVALVGGKNASLGELYSVLAEQGVRVPNGFALTADAYRNALTQAGAWDRLHGLFDSVDKTRIDELAGRAAEARAIVFDATGTDRLRQDIAEAYRQLENEYGPDVAVAVRSSATAEDPPTASFAGQHESFLNVRGASDLFEACRRGWQRCPAPRETSAASMMADFHSRRRGSRRAISSGRISPLC
jgi:pyruvate, water dikinase